ncbi:MAG: hypothetical protein Q7U92_02465, partial [Bradyrhizobium sp.]|nr:hypothetical protein [Bradyrhizobium sp.]
LTQIGSNYYLSTGGTGITIKYAGSPIAQGQFGIWTPIGAEQTASGYTVVMKFGAADQYTIWSMDSNGNYLSNGAVVAGSHTSVTSLESNFQQDLNGDGTMSSAAAPIGDSAGMNAPRLPGISSGDNFALDVLHDFDGSSVDGWHLDSIAHLLTELFDAAQASHQDTTFTAAHDTHEAFANYGSSMPAKALLADLHTGFLIVH